MLKTLAGCRICGAPIGEPVFSLGTMPLPNAFLSKAQLSDAEPLFPLNVHLCESCGLGQLGHVVDPGIMFGEYAFFTAASGPSVTHFDELSSLIRKEFCSDGDLVVEIGSNDGTLTGHLADRNLKAVGVDGALNCVALARKTYPKAHFVDQFFNSKVAAVVKREFGEANVVVACNVVAHIDEVNDLFDGMQSLLARDGTIIIEVPSLEDLVQGLAYDTIYHEHLSYFSVTAFDALASRHNLYVHRVQRIPRHAGSIRVFLRRKNSSDLSQEVSQMIQAERNTGCASRKTWGHFCERAEEQRYALLKMLKEMKQSGRRVVGYGAAAKATVLLNYCKIGTDLMEFCTDTTPAKIGRYIPGVRIPIVDVRELYRLPVSKTEPRIALMHCWNYKDPVLAKEKAWLAKGGEFILPLPSPRLISARD